MDTASEPSSALDTDQAAAAFAQLLDAPPAEPLNPEDATPPAQDAREQPEEDKPDDDAPEDGDAPDPDETITIEVDGKSVEIKKSELPDLYKGQLRQADYTKKTMATAEERKAAEAEKAAARTERQQLYSKLQQADMLLASQEQQYSPEALQRLIDSDPVEAMRQMALKEQRQATRVQYHAEMQRIAALEQSEQRASAQAFVQEQQEKLLAKLPEWKDASKREAARVQLRDYLISEGFEDGDISRISDHRSVLLARKAMLYDQTVAKARAAEKRVAQVPQRVERPAGGNATALDGRTTAMKQLAKSGSVEDAARVFANLI